MSSKQFFLLVLLGLSNMSCAMHSRAALAHNVRAMVESVCGARIVAGSVFKGTRSALVGGMQSMLNTSFGAAGHSYHASVVRCAVEQGEAYYAHGIHTLAYQASNGTGVIPEERELELRNELWTVFVAHGKHTLGDTMTRFDATVKALDAGMSPNALLSEKNISLLDMAISMKCSDIAVLALSRGADVHAKDKQGHTSLHKAILKGELVTLQTLLNRGAGVNAQGEKGNTPLDAAAWSGSAHAVILLLEAQADVTLKQHNGLSPLHTALYKFVEIAKLGSEVEAKEASSGQLAVIKALLAGKVPVNGVGKDGDTPLHVAVQMKHADSVSLLLKHGAVVNAQNKKGVAPLHLAGDNEQITRILLAHNADVDLQADDDITPLHVAAAKGNVACVQMLIASKAEVNAISKSDGWTPLHGAAYEGHADAIELLLKNKACAAQQSVDGVMPLDAAIAGSRAIRLLVEADAPLFAIHMKRMGDSVAFGV